MKALCAALVMASTVAMADESSKKAVFAAGCFWCIEKPFDQQEGVLDTVVGYSGGKSVDPSYKEVSAGGSGHKEVIEVTYDPAKVSYDTLLTIFWHNVDPLDGGGQFCDRGEQYQSAIYYLDDEQKELAIASKKRFEKELGQSFATEVVKGSKFYKAEAYHQDYYIKNPIRYKYYRYRCGRDQRLQEVWKE